MTNTTPLIHKRFYKSALNAKLDEHLGYKKHGSYQATSFQNGINSKALYTKDNVFHIDTLHNRNGRIKRQRSRL